MYVKKCLIHGLGCLGMGVGMTFEEDSLTTADIHVELCRLCIERGLGRTSLFVGSQMVSALTKGNGLTT